MNKGVIIRNLAVGLSAVVAALGTVTAHAEVAPSDVTGVWRGPDVATSDCGRATEQWAFAAPSDARFAVQIRSACGEYDAVGHYFTKGSTLFMHVEKCTDNCTVQWKQTSFRMADPDTLDVCPTDGSDCSHFNRQ